MEHRSSWSKCISSSKKSTKENCFGYRGKVVAITGASSGIGRATAKLLAERGAFVVLGARREEALAAIVDEITAGGGKAAYKVTDVRRRSELEALVALAIEQGGSLDVIVNNAGIGPISRFDALRVEDWDAMIDVNLRGTLYGIAAALPVFQRQQSGHADPAAKSATASRLNGARGGTGHTIPETE